MLLDLSKYDNLKTYQRHGKECYMDNITKQLRPKTPEETIRQKILMWLIKDLEVPEFAIAVEESMAHYEKKNAKRADICVYARYYDEKQQKVIDLALLVIECKKETVPLTDDVFIQGAYYADTLGAPLMAITNGIEFELYKYDDKDDRYHLLKEVPKYKQLCEPNNLEAYPNLESKYVRYADYFNTTEELYSTLYDHGLIGKSTDIKKCPVIAKMIDLLLDDKYILKSLDIDGCTFIKDNGVRNTSFGNYAGGSYPGDYRTFAIMDGSGNTQIISIGIFGTFDCINDEKFGTRKGHTTLNVAIDDFKKSHNSLQLKLDENLHINSGKITITHNGKLTKGKSGAVKSELVREYIKRNSNIKFLGDQMILGSWVDEDEYDINSTSIKQFLSNLIKYALLRDEFRNIND
ncbi:MAG: type I restriction enzyme HsdR N-terminal domain-containing protein [Phascolarctobacterium sp.]|nr:type I restriction enzyme HsdR N-terminal domain-containing protein [Phascolarctobacterium sp.]